MMIMVMMMMMMMMVMRRGPMTAKAFMSEDPWEHVPSVQVHCCVESMQPSMMAL
jgi:hypothetical protein